MVIQKYKVDIILDLVLIVLLDHVYKLYYNN